MTKVVFILGPTGVGKTKMSISLAKKFDGEIISADSVQVFKGLNIGSAKITKNEMQGVKHYAIDILEPDEEFSVFDFVQYTKQKIEEISARGKLPIIVGGTGLYVKALTEGYDFGGTNPDKNLREKLEKIAQEKGNDHLFELLKEKNPAMAEKTDKHNTVRLIRALEIALGCGEKSKNDVNFEFFLVALTRNREKLYEIINDRVDKMLEDGLIEEVEQLKKRGLSEKNQSMRAIGYKEILAFLNGEYDRERMVELLKQHSRNYAKRQMTFLRGMNDVHYVDVENFEEAEKKLTKQIGDWLNE